MSTSSITEKLKILEEIIRVPRYGVVGVTQNKLVYVSTVEGVFDLWTLDLETSKTVKVTSGGIHDVADVKSSSPLVIYTKDVSGGKELHQVFKVDVREGKELKVGDFKPKRIFGIAFDGEKAAFTCSTEKEIEVYSVKPQGEYEKLYSLKYVAIVSTVDKDVIAGYGSFKDPRIFELFILNINTGEFKVYTPKEGATCKPPKAYNGKLLFSTNAFGDEKLVVYDVYSNELKEPEFQYSDYKKYKFSEYAVYGWTQEGKIWFIGKANGRTRTFIDGREVPLPEGYVENIAIHGSKVYASWSSLTTPSRIYMVNMNTGEVKEILGAKLPDYIVKRFGTVTFVKYESFDGLEIPAFIVESTIAPKPGPTVIYVHGGPWSEVADCWRTFIASLVALGYHVVAPNFRDSTGYGEEFRRLDIGDPGGGDLMDVVYARNYAVKLGIADPNKVAIMGYSYGGFMTYLATVKHPDLWRCGVAGAGITDWVEMYELSDALFRKFMEMLFAGRRDLWKDRSAVNYISNLKAPLCIIHPQNDTRTPLKPILEYCMKLLELGKGFELHVVPDMGHIIIRLDDAIKLLFPASIPR